MLKPKIFKPIFDLLIRCKILKPKILEEFYENGQLKSREFWANGKLHRDLADGPAIEEFYENGQVHSRECWVNGKLHRDTADGPAIEEFYENGQLKYRQFWVDGKFNREPREGPAVEYFYDNGQLKYRQFRVDGKSNRESREGPAVEHFYNNGQLKYRQFRADGKIHREIEEGPAREWFYTNGQLKFIEFWVNGKLHRDPKDGPAIERFYENGQLYSREFWLNGLKDPFLAEEPSPAPHNTTHNSNTRCHLCRLSLSPYMEYYVDDEEGKEENKLKRIPPLVGKDGWYYNRHIKFSWYEYKGQAFELDSKDFLYNLELANAKRLMPKERDIYWAALRLRPPKAIRKKIQEILQLDGELRALHDISRGGIYARARFRQFMKNRQQ